MKNFRSTFLEFISSNSKYLLLDGNVLFAQRISNNIGKEVLLFLKEKNVYVLLDTSDISLYASLESRQVKENFDYIIEKAKNSYNITIPEEGDFEFSSEKLEINSFYLKQNKCGLILINESYNPEVYFCDFMGHSALYCNLKILGKVDKKYYSDHNTSDSLQKQILYFSYGEIGGSLYFYYKFLEDTDKIIDENDLNVAIKLYRLLVNYQFIEKSYIEKGNFSKFAFILYKTIVKYYENNGAKYANIMFLKKCYDYLTPEISIDEIKGDISIRSSPLKSAPGIYNSIIGNGDLSDFKSINPTLGDNFFYQKTIYGINGVAEINDVGYYAYYSTNNGGVTSNTSNIIYDNDIELKQICEALSFHLGHNIQIEYVKNEEGIYIVQLRVFKKKSFEVNSPPDDSITGQSYVTGEVCGDFMTDIICIKDDSDDINDLIALTKAKGLIFNGKNNLCHLVTYARVNNIPTILNVDTSTLKKGDKILLNTINSIGYIQKINQ